MSGARSGARVTGQVISAIDIADISIRALREEGDLQRLCLLGLQPISIHALREEGDKAALLLVIYGKNFYPRPPRGGRHSRRVCMMDSDKISIHALREEGDSNPRK